MDSKYLSEDFKRTQPIPAEYKAKANYIKRYKPYEPDQILFIEFNPARSFSKGIFERFIVDTMQETDISEFIMEEGKDEGGPEGYNPRAMLAVLFYAYADGMFSSRRIAKLCLHDMRYIFISGYTAPEHSTISRFINNNAEAIKNIFVQVLYIANNLGFIDYKMIATDGSKIKANAATKYTGTIEDFKKKLERLEKKITLAIKKQQETDKTDEKEYWGKKEERYRKNKEKIDEFLKEAKPLYTKKGKEIKQNITDKDCKLMRNQGSIQESYNANISTDNKHAIILANEVTNVSDDTWMFQPLIEQSIENVPDHKKQKAKQAKFLNDAGYYAMDNLLYCEENNIDAYLPDTQDRNLYSDSESNDKVRLSTSIRCEVKLHKGKTRIICKGGQVLEKLDKQRIEAGNLTYIFVPPDSTKCLNCKNHNECMAKVQNRKEFKMKAKIFDNWYLVEKMRAKLKTEKGRMIYSRRMPTIEKIFGHIKKNMGCIRFRVRGIEKVKTEWSMICTVYNLKRIFNLKTA